MIIPVDSKQSKFFNSQFYKKKNNSNYNWHQNISIIVYSILLFFKFIICCFRKKEETKRYNTYASEKAKGFIPPENVISEGNVDSIIPVKGKSYLITAGGWDNERENHATKFSNKYLAEFGLEKEDFVLCSQHKPLLLLYKLL